jgi:hypothetical protein
MNKNRDTFDIIYDLLVSHANIDPSLIDHDQWRAAIDLWADHIKPNPPTPQAQEP